MSTPKIALVTGASSGIGKATAERLLRDGYIVYGAARRVEMMADLDAHERGHALRLDVTDEASCEAAIQTILDAHGRIDVLVNNAGYAVYGAVEDISIDEARRQFEVNLFGLARVTQLVLPTMRAMRSGTIVNVSSMGGEIYTLLGAWYHATKHALEGWSDSLRLELAPFGIDVVIVQPGAIQTEFGDVMMDPMVERSADGPYGELVRRMAKATKDSYADGKASPPSLIADTIAKAVAADRPKTRYVAGKMARPLMFARKWLGDRIFDKAVMSAT